MAAAGTPHALIRIPAVLCGPDDVAATCFVETWKERSSAGKTYTRCRIADEPQELPDGDYTLEFAEQTVRTSRHHGKWALTFLCSEVERSEAA